MPEVNDTPLDKPHKKAKSFLNKVIIRKLPPNLNAEAFMEIISPLPDYYDLYFCPADWTLGAEATSRAYIEFKNEEDIFIFKDKFDGYVFVDAVRGSEYPAIVEYASFQGIPKSRSRKKDKNVGTIELEQHFLTFLENLKKEEEAEANKSDQITRIEYSYKIKDDKKITSTPLIEFLSAKNQEKRDAKRQKIEEKRKQRDEEKQKKKIQIAKNVPEPINEAKEDATGEDGIMVRTVPSRLGRNDRKKEPKSESKPKPEDNEKEQERRDRREKLKHDRDARRKVQKEEKRKSEREYKDQEKEKGKDDPKKSSSVAEKPASSLDKPDPPKESKKDAPAKAETKRYSALRKARQEKPDEAKCDPEEPSLPDDCQDEVEKPIKKKKIPKELLTEQDRQEARQARMKKVRENKERRAREEDERAQRQIKNKDRPTLQIYQPKRRHDNEAKPENSKSSEDSDASRKKSDNDRRNEKRDRRPDKKNSRKNSRDETARKKKTSRKNSEDGAADKGEPGKPLEAKDSVAITEKLKKLLIDQPFKSEESKAEE